MIASSLLPAFLFLTPALSKTCMDLMIPVTVESRQPVFDKEPILNNLDAAEFTLGLVKNGFNYAATILTEYSTSKQQLNISARFCTHSPDPTKPEGSAVQFLVHGLGSDKSYWSLPSANYEAVATDMYGFNTLAIDRPGAGLSTHKDPLNIIQTSLQVEVIYEITKMLREGRLPRIPRKFSQVVHVGFSYGSILCYKLAALHPYISNGLVLTGFSANFGWLPRTLMAFNLQVAGLNNPARFSALQSGYLTWSDITSNIIAFLAPGYFATSVALQSEYNKQPFTTGELLTIADVPHSASDFTAPVLVINGEYDGVFCGGNCYGASSNGGPSILDDVREFFPMVRMFKTYVQPHTGHAINLHYNASGAYDMINGFLAG